MKPTFESTVDILVKAYLNDTLRHGECCACAVGNIIASNIGCVLQLDSEGYFMWIRNMNEINTVWDNVFYTTPDGNQIFDKSQLGIREKKQIEASGYSLDELMRIEKAFESLNFDRDSDQWNSDNHMYEGLMAVVDVLADIHGIDDLKSKEEAKLLFVKP